MNPLVKPSVLHYTEVCKMGYIDVLNWVALFLLYLYFIIKEGCNLLMLDYYSSLLL